MDGLGVGGRTRGIKCRVSVVNCFSQICYGLELEYGRVAGAGQGRKYNSVAGPSESFDVVNDNRKLCDKAELEDAPHTAGFNVRETFRSSINNYVYLTRDCIKKKLLTDGKRVHMQILESGCVPNIFLGNLLVDMYNKCGSLLEARQVFDKMAAHNVFSYTAIISAYAKEGQYEEAVNLFYHMVQAGIVPDKVVLVAIIKACSSMDAPEWCKHIHAFISKCGFELDVFVGCALVDMYAKGGSIEEARQVFNKMQMRDVVLWTAMIAGYAQQGHFETALTLFEQMQVEGVEPNNVTFVSLLKSCANFAAFEWGKQAHAYIVRSGVKLNFVAIKILVDMYVKCGSIENAHLVFNNMVERDVISYNIMISAYAKHGGEVALMLFEQMLREGVHPNNVTFLSMLKACTNLGALEQGKQIHAHISKSEFTSDVSIGNALVDMYVTCGRVDDAHEVFDKICKRDVISWTAMISGYAQHGYAQKALLLLQKMEEEGVRPNNVTFLTILKACANIRNLELGKHVHAYVIKYNLESDVFVENTLIDMYMKSGSVESACHVFNKMHCRDRISWNIIIGGFVQHGYCEEVLTLFEQMQEDGMEPDSVTFVNVLKACVSLGALEKGKQVHALIKEKGCESDTFVGSAIVCLHARCGSIDDAHKAFNQICVRDIVVWNAMIAGCAQQRHGEESLLLFQQMQSEGIEPDIITFISILKACASVGAVEQGKQIHGQIINCGFESDVSVGSALVHMYLKGGSLGAAQRVFDKMHEHDFISWTSMLAGYAQEGRSREALALFEQMQLEGMKPDTITFVFVLSACSHACLVHEAQYYFDFMIRIYGITPRKEHCVCMVDLLSRVGLLDEAEDFIKKMPIQPDSAVWMTLLSACRNHGNIELGKHSFASIMKVEPKRAGAYVLLSNLYAAVGRWNEVTKVRREMEKAGCKKELHYKGIEAKRLGRTKKNDTEAELKRLAVLVEDSCYVRDMSFVLQE